MQSTTAKKKTRRRKKNLLTGEQHSRRQNRNSPICGERARSLLQIIHELISGRNSRRNFMRKIVRYAFPPILAQPSTHLNFRSASSPRRKASRTKESNRSLSVGVAALLSKNMQTVASMESEIGPTTFLGRHRGQRIPASRE